eukprot:gene23969-9543_t
MAKRQSEDTRIVRYDSGTNQDIALQPASFARVSVASGSQHQEWIQNQAGGLPMVQPQRMGGWQQLHQKQANRAWERLEQREGTKHWHQQQLQEEQIRRIARDEAQLKETIKSHHAQREYREQLEQQQLREQQQQEAIY